MSFFDRINRYFAGRIRRAPRAAEVKGDFVNFGGKSLNLSHLRAAVAYEGQTHDGSVLALALRFSSGELLTVTQEEAAWNDLLSALDRLGLSSSPSREWLTKLISQAGDSPAIVLLGEDEGRV